MAGSIFVCITSLSGFPSCGVVLTIKSDSDDDECEARGREKSEKIVCTEKRWIRHELE